MNRAHAILAEWDRKVTEAGARTPGEARREHDIKALADELRQVKRDRTTLHRRLDAAATVIAALHLENRALREQLHRSDVIDPRSRRQPGAEQEAIGPC